jgi:hypothetical protein
VRGHPVRYRFKPAGKRKRSARPPCLRACCTACPPGSPGGTPPGHPDRAAAPAVTAGRHRSGRHRRKAPLRRSRRPPRPCPRRRAFSSAGGYDLG